ncbi:MAG TPA: nucleotide sugar dehydrogenase [bacterium]|nr:nucleotide sugar dehydrogenase [bacterium]HQL62822.1 nucleotide sugar dehydrogenase [bacterium]
MTQSVTPNAKELIERFENGTAGVGVIGMGYVGLPLAMLMVKAGYRTLGFDVDWEKVDRLNRGESYIHHFPAERIQEARKDGKFQATTDYARLKEVDAIIICVPTPLNEYREPDLSYVEATGQSVGEHLRRGQIVILESTTYPGTTEELLLARLSESGLRVGQDFFLVYSPEREDPGNAHYNTRTIPKVLGGITRQCLAVGEAFYGRVFEKIVPVSSTAAAEMTKLLENIYRAVNIALVNELKILADRMGLDIWEVIEAASSKPFGYHAFYPGPGWGGHCIPIDPFYLTWKARQFGFATRFIELAGEVNTGMPRFVVGKIVKALALRGISIAGAQILVLGMAYKRDVDDPRESPAIKVVELLREWHIDVSYHDPYIPHFPTGRHGDLGLSSVPLTPERLAEADAVLILTDHSCIDYQEVVRHAKLVIDTRNATRSVTEARERIIRA